MWQTSLVTPSSGPQADTAIIFGDKLSTLVLAYLYDKPVYANDFPGGESRLVQKPAGLRYSIVN